MDFPRSNAFDDRRLSDPQGVIDDLVQQTTKQAVKINKLTAALERQAEQLKTALADIPPSSDAEAPF